MPAYFCRCLLVLALSAPIWALADDVARVDSYDVKIDAPKNVSDLLESYLDVYRWRKQKDLAVDDLQAAVDRTPQDATNLLNTEGYFSPLVKATLNHAGDRYSVDVHVETGPVTTVRKVDFRLTGTVNDDVPYRDNLLQRLKTDPALKEGSVFTQSQWDAYKRRALTALQNRRYAAAFISESQALVDPKANAVDLTMVLDSGPFYRYGEASISGMQRYPEQIVRDQIHLNPGDEYRRYQLLQLQSDLQDIPQVATAIVDTQLSAEPPYTAPIDITIQEAPLQKLGLAAGYSTNTRYRGQIDYRYNNVANRGWVWTTKATYEGLEQSLITELAFPKQEDGYNNKLYVNADHSDVQGLVTTTYKGGFSKSRTDRDIDRTITIEYQAERRDVGDGQIDTPHALTANYKWVRRDLDSQRDPHRGNVLQLEGGGASGQLLSTQTFVRLYGKGSVYYPVGETGIFLGRLELGQNFARNPDGVPTDWLFRAGGSGSVRGYDYQALGVKADDGTIVPGRVLATSSAEYQHPVYKDWRGAVFVDYGDAADSWQSWEGRTGVGVGARWISPVGSIGADLAYGVQDRKIRFHFALGMAF
ncbi:Translocation and assembly module TamA precursor [Amantichitinum ursilacus]|uniref:Translocation and assembly module TamA n=1 Tax=Amantichitinum ursilacus TaxID=857265 RepID=A0A0N0GQH6_9NEIS|nr:Translocation and assembly module TamA precursor [Amantichitinum ursilacus]